MKNDNIDSSSFIYVLRRIQTLFIQSVTSFVFGFVFIGANNGFCYTLEDSFLFFSFLLLFCVCFFGSFAFQPNILRYLYLEFSLTWPAFPTFFIIIPFFFCIRISAPIFSFIDAISRVECSVVSCVIWDLTNCPIFWTIFELFSQYQTFCNSNQNIGTNALLFACLRAAAVVGPNLIQT